MMRRTTPIATACVALLLAVSACGSGGDGSREKPGGKNPGKESNSSAPERPTFDPPLAVSGAPTFTLNGSVMTYAAQDGAAYVMTDGKVEKVDLASGDPLWGASIEGLVERGSPSTFAGAVATIAGEPSLVFIYHKELAGTGTEADVKEDRIAVVSSKTGKLRWDVKAPDTGQTSSDWDDGRSLKLAGVTDDLIVIGADWDSDEHPVGTAVLNGTDGSLLWEKDVFATVAANGMVVAQAKNNTAYKMEAWVLGLDARSGKQVWTTPRGGLLDEPTSAGSGLVQSKDMNKSDGHNDLLDIKTGEKKALAIGECVYDEKSLLVCHHGDKKLVGYEQQSLKKLWSIEKDATEGGRVVPYFTTAWHGAVYTLAGGKDNVVLDGRTGKDKVADLGLEPDVVVKGYIIADEKVFPATK